MTLLPIAELNSLRSAAVSFLEVLSVEPILAHRDERIPRLRRELIRMFRRQGRIVTKSFLPHTRTDKLYEAQLPDSLLRLLMVLLDHEDSHWAERFSSMLEETALAAGVQMATDFALSGSFVDFPVQRVIDEIRQNSLTLVRNLNATTLEQVRGILENGIENHLAYTAVAKQIREHYRAMGMFTPGGKRDRASLIAVNEIGQAYTNAQMSIGHAMVDTGLTMEKFWQTVEDERVDPDICELNQAAGWIPFNETFPSGHDAPLGHAGCRCAALMRRAKT